MALAFSWAQLSAPKGWDGEGTKTLTWQLVPLLGLGQGFWPTRGLCSKAWGAGQLLGTRYLVPDAWGWLHG